MNKIYKVIWSKAKNCYVVASELAKRSGKSAQKAILTLLLLKKHEMMIADRKIKKELADKFGKKIKFF